MACRTSSTRRPGASSRRRNPSASTSISGEVRDHRLHAARGGEGIGAALDELRRAVTREVEHHHDDPCAAGRQVHRAADPADAGGGNVPVREVPVARHLEAAQHDGGHAPAARHREGAGAVEEARPRVVAHELAAGVVAVDVLLAVVVGERAEAEHAVLGVQRDALLGVECAREQGGQAETEVHVLARVQQARHPAHHQVGRDAGRSRRALAHLEVVLPSPPLAQIADRGDVERALAAHDAIDEDAGRDHALGIQRAGLHDLVDLRDRHARAGRHHGIEVARPAPVDEVAVAVGARRADQGVVAAQRRLEEVAPAVELAHLAVARDVRVDARRGVERRQPGAARHGCARSASPAGSARARCSPIGSRRPSGSAASGRRRSWRSACAPGRPRRGPAARSDPRQACWRPASARARRAGAALPAATWASSARRRSRR